MHGDGQDQGVVLARVDGHAAGVAYAKPLFRDLGHLVALLPVEQSIVAARRRFMPAPVVTAPSCAAGGQEEAAGGT